MGLYVRNLEVKDRLRGKVMFTEDPDDPNLFSERLLNRLIAEAEADVEHDLSQRYAAPFQTREGRPFGDLPERPTKEYLRSLCELKAVVTVLEYDFGMGAVDADEFIKRLNGRYESMLDRHLKRRHNDQNQWFTPPLPGLRLAPHNSEADDGFRGMVHNTNDDFPYHSNQINDPSVTWWNVTSEDIYGD